MSIEEDVLDSPGCYVLALIIEDNLEVRTRSSFFKIPRGIYFYVGSAKGPGGVKNRVFRHLLRNGRRHWHIDYLLDSVRARVAGFYTIPSKRGVDCEVEAAKALSTALKPVLGFGSTDKIGDVSHLYMCSYRLEECLGLVYELLSEKVCEPSWFQNI
ncbi:MAG: GIY-YIG nuclease family protein [Thermosphaera sp.]